MANKHPGSPNSVLKIIEEYSLPELKLIRSQRPYKIPKGFMGWRVLSALITSSIVTIGNKFSSDWTSRLIAYHHGLWLIQNGPIYLLSEDLLESLSSTDILNQKEMLEDLDEIPAPTFLVMLPEGKIISPEGASVDFLSIHIGYLHKPEDSRGAGFGIELGALHQREEELINISYGTVDSHGTGWSGGVGLMSNGEVLLGEHNLGSASMDEADISFMSSLRSLGLQIILVIMYEPELLDVQKEPAQPRSKGFAKESKKETISWAPRWIGRTYSYERQPSKGGTHISPRQHWRRGHYKRVAIGKGRVDRKWVRIQRVLVNKNKDS